MQFRQVVALICVNYQKDVQCSNAFYGEPQAAGIIRGVQQRT